MDERLVLAVHCFIVQPVSFCLPAPDFCQPGLDPVPGLIYRRLFRRTAVNLPDDLNRKRAGAKAGKAPARGSALRTGRASVKVLQMRPAEVRGQGSETWPMGQRDGPAARRLGGSEAIVMLASVRRKKEKGR
jgi:hypothetical protein